MSLFNRFSSIAVLSVILLMQVVVWDTGIAQETSKVKISRSSKSVSTVEKDLVACWKFDEGEGTTVRDSSGHDYHGLIIGAKWVKNESGHCLHFNGKDNYLQFSFKLREPVVNGTFEAWAKPDLNGHWGSTDYGEKRDGDVLNTGRVIMRVFDNSWMGIIYDGINVSKLVGPEVIDNKWTHLAMTWTGFTARFYVDGEEVEQGAFSLLKYIGSIVAQRGGPEIRFWVGSQNPRWPNIHPFNGLIDEVKLYNRALTAEEIKKHAKSPNW